MINMNIETVEIKKLVETLRDKHAKGIKYAIKRTLDKAAYETSQHMKRHLTDNFIIRNSYVNRSIQYRRANGLIISNMESSAGSTLEFMARQEEGFELHGTGSTGGVTIPTTAVTNQYGSTRRTKAITQKNQMKAIQLTESQKRNKSTIAKIYAARAQGKKEIFIDKETDRWKRTSGIYRIIKWKKKTKRGWSEGAKLRLLYALEDKSIRVKPRKWLNPSLEAISKRVNDYYRDALIEQLKRI